MTEINPAVAIEALRGEMHEALARLQGQVEKLNTSVQLSLQGMREQFAGFMAALGHKDGDCSKCRQVLDARHQDHEERLRLLESAKWKLIGALLLAGPLWGAVCGAVATLLLSKVMK